MALQFKDGPFKGSYTTNDLSRGPQKNIQSAFDAPRGLMTPSSPAVPKSSAPKTQGTPYQAYAQQGQAQSIPPQSQGTPYQAYAQPRPASQTVTGDPRGGYVTAPASQRPPPFQMGTAQTPWGQSMDPFVEREAFVNQLNQQRMQNQIAFNSGGPINPAAGITPGLDYQKAMQQAGLGGGAPSMAANYGDSMIGRLNQAFGGQGDPFTFAKPQTPAQQFAGIYAPGTDITKLPFTDTMQPNPAYRQPAAPPGWSPSNDFGTPRPDGGALWGSPAGKAQPIQPASQGTSYQPFVNQQGQQFQGTMSFAPGTSQAYQNQAYGNYANQQGYYQPQGSPPQAQQPAPSMAGSGGYNPGWGIQTPAAERPHGPVLLPPAPAPQPAGQQGMDPKSKQFWTDYLSSPRVKDWAMKGDGPAAENAKQKMQQLANSGPRPFQSRR